MPRRSYASGVYGLMGLGAIGFAARLAVALLSTGSNDILLWSRFATGVGVVGVGTTYQLVEEFNHPPLMGYLAAAVLRFSQLLDVPFAVSFKIPMILADLLTTVLLWKIWKDARGPRAGGPAVVAFSWSIVAILVSGFHGNTDSLCASLCLFAAYGCDRKKPLIGGLALAAAINVKLIPIVLVPAFVLTFRSWRPLVQFCVGLAVGVLPFLPFFICCGPSFYRNAIAYESNVEHWGIMFVLMQSEAIPRVGSQATRFGQLYLAAGRYLVLGLPVLAGVWARFGGRWSQYELGAICFAIFLIFTPGFGLQYTVYAVPFLCAVSLRWANLYSLLAGVFLILVYGSFWTGSVPVLSMLTARFPIPAALVGLLAWTALLGFVLWRLCGPNPCPDPHTVA